MSRILVCRCDRCMTTYDPANSPAEFFRIFSEEQDGYLDLCRSCRSDLKAWMRFPLEDEAGRGAIDFTTGEPA